jgi:NTP pyrophosphatase (non-canonical NTP hydrolase)
MDLNELAEEVEAVSTIYAERFDIHRDETWFLLKLQEEMGELTQSFLMRAGQARSKGKTAEEIEQAFRAEMADVLAHLLLFARHCDVDLQTAIEDKWLPYNPKWAARFPHKQPAE